jgi:hypothetical protein
VALPLLKAVVQCPKGAKGEEVALQSLQLAKIDSAEVAHLMLPWNGSPGFGSAPFKGKFEHFIMEKYFRVFNWNHFNIMPLGHLPIKD